MKNKPLLTVLALAALGISVQATPITFTFLENGQNTALGSSSTFTQSGATLTAYASPGSILYAKNIAAGEQGLGITSDPSGDNEIWGQTFVQLLSSTSSGFEVQSITTGSTTDGEIADIWFSSTLGSLGTLIGFVTSNTSFTIPFADENGYIGVSSPNGNVLLGSATGVVPSRVPDGGSTMLLMGSALAGLGLIRRKLQA